MRDAWWKKWHWFKFRFEYFGLQFSIAFHKWSSVRIFITRRTNGRRLGTLKTLCSSKNWGAMEWKERPLFIFNYLNHIEIFIVVYWSTLFFKPTNCTGSNALFRSLVYCVIGHAVNHLSWNLKVRHCFTPKPAFCMLSRHRKMSSTASNIAPLKLILLLPSYLSFGFPICVFNLDQKFYTYGLRQKIGLPDDTPNGSHFIKSSRSVMV
jgi:hypothetical protein